MGATVEDIRRNTMRVRKWETYSATWEGTKWETTERQGGRQGSRPNTRWKTRWETKTRWKTKWEPKWETRGREVPRF